MPSSFHLLALLRWWWLWHFSGEKRFLTENISIQAHRLSVLLIDYHFQQRRRRRNIEKWIDNLLFGSFVSGNNLASNNSFQQLEHFSPINRQTIRDIYELWRWKKENFIGKNHNSFALANNLCFFSCLASKNEPNEACYAWTLLPSVSSNLKLIKTQHCMLRAFIVINISFLLFTFGGRSNLKPFNCIFRRLTTFVCLKPLSTLSLVSYFCLLPKNYLSLFRVNVLSMRRLYHSWNRFCTFFSSLADFFVRFSDRKIFSRISENKDW